MKRLARVAAASFLLACGRHAPPVTTASVAPAWTHGAVCYEIFVRSFVDSNGDGIGDLNGLIGRLDYINDGNPTTHTDLGASCIWLMPIAESPSYHGYDVSNYYRVKAEYGTNDDFKRLMVEAHRRGIRVLVDMVLNHASSEHPSFQAALRDTTSHYRSWYRFARTADGKGPWGEEVWHRSPVRDEYYYGVFWKGMPDLNYTSPEVREEAKRVATFWLRDMGVDGFRLDAVPYLVEEGSCLTGCAGTHAFLREYASHLRTIAPDAFTIGEVWGTADTLTHYYSDQLTAYFAFELADSLIAAARRGTAGGLLSSFRRFQQLQPADRWSPLLSNHDGTRSMTRLGDDVRRAKVAATLLLTLPGLPFVYYGEEIGMTGDKPDERLRTPMQWSPARGLGFTTGAAWEAAQADSLRVTVEQQQADSLSLLHLYRRLIPLRATTEPLASGDLSELRTNDSGVVAFARRAGPAAVLVVANLGEQPADLALSSASGLLPSGEYGMRELLREVPVTQLVVAADGSLQSYRPIDRPLAPGESLILELMTPNGIGGARPGVPASLNPSKVNKKR
ncbi:MAG: alpha-amylase family glycosyl hydrolase [Gemmatimonadaceae bacterium]